MPPHDESPLAQSSSAEVATRSSFSRPLAAILLTVLGAPAGAVLCSIGYLAVIVILESALVPPLHSPENYGQFGFLLIYFGFFGLFFGASFGLLPYTRFLLWLPVFLLIAFVTFTAEGDLPRHFNATEITCSAMLIIAAGIVLLAALTSFVIRKLEGRTPHARTDPASMPDTPLDSLPAAGVSQ